VIRRRNVLGAQRSKLASLIVVAIIVLLQPVMSSGSVAVSRNYWPTNGWIEESPSKHGMNSTKIQEMDSLLVHSDYPIDGLLVVRGGYLVYEAYYSDSFYQDTPHMIYSCTKSVISSGIGLALDQGYIESLDQKVLDFFPNRTIDNWDPRKEDITIRHLLTMTSGLEWHELDRSYSEPSNSFNLLQNSDDWVSYVLNQSMVTDPGAEWNYNSGTSHLLSAILQEAAGMPTPELLSTIYDAVSNVSTYDVFWQADPQGIFFGGSGLQLNARDMARVGYLYLNNGAWDGQQLIPEEYVLESTSSHVALTNETHYGYQWWIYNEYNAYVAVGFAGQYIMIIPSLDMVIVCISSLYDTSERPFWDIVSDYILPSVLDGPDSVADSIPVLIAFSLVTIVVLVLIITRLRKH